MSPVEGKPSASSSPQSATEATLPTQENISSTAPQGRAGHEEKKIKTLRSKIAILQAQISQTEDLLATTLAKLSIISPSQNPSAIVQRHIRLLHQYNEIKDIGQGLMGLIAEARGVRYVDVQSEYEVEERD